MQKIKGSHQRKLDCVNIVTNNDTQTWYTKTIKYSQKELDPEKNPFKESIYTPIV